MDTEEFVYYVEKRHTTYETYVRRDIADTSRLLIAVYENKEDALAEIRKRAAEDIARIYATPIALSSYDSVDAVMDDAIKNGHADIKYKTEYGSYVVTVHFVDGFMFRSGNDDLTVYQYVKMPFIRHN